MDMGDLVRRHRGRLGLSQQDLATRSGLSVRAIRDLERGRVGTPRVQSVHGLAVALELTGPDLDDLRAAAADRTPDREDRRETGREDRRETGREAGPAKTVPRPIGTDASPIRAGGRAAAPRIGVLGPLTVQVGGAVRDVASPLRRALLGLLALHPHQVVSREEIVDTLWGPRPPRTCLSLVHVYVGQLRRLLEPQRARRAPARTVVLAGGGYRLEVEPDQVDAAEFDAIVARANRARATGEGERALSLYTTASRLWRGPVLADGAASVRQHPTAVALSQRRVAAALAMADVAGRLGRLEEAMPWLRSLARDEALNEALHARLMLALAASGEQAAALRVYADLRDRLGDELGIAPGAELQDAHVRVLRQEYIEPDAPQRTTAGPVPPAQLPADVAAFTGRAEHLREMEELVTPSASPAVVIVAITGTPGVGKTALAIHFGHRVRERYPDGQLYVNLRGHAAGPSVRPIEALAGFLVALGVPPDQVLLDVDQAAALYRSLLADRRVLVLLDNVGDVNDIRTMLPGGAGSLVLVTSRDQLAGLVARDGARRISLDVMSAGEAHNLLGRLVGPDRVLAELEATAELASLCARLPLALRIAAANLTAQRQHSLARYADELRAGNRLAALVVDGDEETAVRAAFDISYTALPEPARRVFRLLGLVPGPDASAEVAAALAGIVPSAATRLLDRLVGAHLIDQHKPGRYTFHDLLRLYAQEKSAQEQGEHDDRIAAQYRLYLYYLHRGHAAARPLFGHMFRLPLPPGDPPPVGDPFPDNAAALAWYDAERANILAAIASASAHGPRRFAWLLADAIRGYLLLRMYTVDWLAMARVGLSAAEAEGDELGQVAMLLSLGVLNSRQSRHERAIEYHSRALALARSAGLAVGESAALSNLGGVYVELGQLSTAADHLHAALAMPTDQSYLGSQVNNLGNLGSVSMYLGRLSPAAEQFRRAVQLAADMGSQTVYAAYLTNLGEAYGLLGHYDEAQAALAEGIDAHRATGNRVSEATSLRCLASVERVRGRLGAALGLAEQAIRQAAESGVRRGEAEAESVLATVHLALGDPQRAADHHVRALGLARETGHHYPEVDTLIGLARAERHLGQRDGARGHLEQALAAARAAEFRLLEGRALAELAELHRDSDDPATARVAAEHALQIQSDCGYQLGIADTLVLLGRLSPTPVGYWERALAVYRGIGAAAATQVSRMIEFTELTDPHTAFGPFIGQNGQHQEGSIP